MEETQTPRARPVRAFVYTEVYKFGILVGDWLVLGAVALCGMIFNYLFPLTYRRIPIGLIGIVLMLGVVYCVLYYVRHGRRRGYFNHRLAVLYWRLWPSDRSPAVEKLLRARRQEHGLHRAGSRIDDVQRSLHKA